MNNVNQDQGYTMDDAKLISMKRTSSVHAGYSNPTYDPCEQAQKDDSSKLDLVITVEFFQETDRGSISSSTTHKPLTENRRNKGCITRNQQSFEGRSHLPGDDPKRKWQSFESYLREQNKDSDPEALTRHKKPFYLRTWFACVTYGFLLMLLIAAILAIACNRTIIVPNTLLDGQIAQAAATRSGRATDVVVQNILTRDSTTSSPTIEQSNNGPPNSVVSGSSRSEYTAKPSDEAGFIRELPELSMPTSTTSSIDDLPLPVARLLADAASKEVVSNPQVPVVAGSIQQPVPNWWNLFSLPGPLQTSSASENSVR